MITLFGLLRTHPTTSERIDRLVNNDLPNNDPPKIEDARNNDDEVVDQYFGGW